MTKTNSELLDQIEALQSQLNEAQGYLRAEREARALSESKGDAIDLDALLQLFSSKIKEIYNFEGHLVNLFTYAPQDSEGNTHERLRCEKISLPPGFEGIEKTYHKYVFPQQDNDANTHALESGAPVLVNEDNVHQFSENTMTRFKRWEISTLVVVPILVQTETSTLATRVGTVAVFMKTGGIEPQHIQEVQRLVSYFSKQISNAVHYASFKEREKEIRHAQKDQNRFLKFISTINNLTKQEQIYDQISQEFLRRFPFDFIAVILEEDNQLKIKTISVSDKKYELRARAIKDLYSNVGYDLDMADGATSTAFIQNSHLVISDAQAIMHLPMSEKDRKGLKILTTPRTFTIVPIRKHDTPIGIMWLISLEKPVELPDSSMRLMELLCNFIGTAISNAKLYSVVEDQNQEIEILNANLQQKVEQLHEIASKDRLTDLFNFGTFEKELKRSINEYNRAPSLSFCLVLFDVDHFKQFNDTYGHLAGNDVLQAIAVRLKKQVREIDIPCRYGGEEFCVILPKCRLEGAAAFAQRLLKAVSDEEFVADGVGVHVTISIGVAEYRTNESAASFIERTDKALYTAKNQGRNCVCSDENETPQSESS